MAIIKQEAEAAYRELMTLVAEMHSHWWNIELDLASLLAALSGMRVRAANAALGTLTSNKVRRDLVLNVATTMLAREADLDKVRKILARMARAASARNQFAHASFGLEHDKKFALRVMSHWPEQGWMRYEMFRKTDILNIHAQLKTLSSDVMALSFEMRGAKRQKRLESYSAGSRPRLRSGSDHPQPESEEPLSPPLPSDE